MPIPSPTGPGTPIINGPGDMSVDEFLVDPLRIQRVITALPGNFYITPLFFADGGVSLSGAVVYNQLLDLDLYIDADPNRQPGNVEPGMEFPNVSVLDRAPLVALIGKIGGYFRVTIEQQMADRRDVIRNGLFRLGNTLVQISNAKALNAMLTDPTVVANCTTPASGVWTTTGTVDPFLDIEIAENSLDNGNDLGLDSNVAVIHPDAKLIVNSWARKQNMAPRENSALNPIFNKDLAGIKGLDWIVSRRCPRTKMIIASRGMVGEIVRRRDPFTNVVPEPLREATVVMSGRSEKHIVNNPYAVRVITGIIT